MDYHVRIENVDSQPLAVVRRQARLGELKVVVPEACGVVWKAVRAMKLEGVGRHVAVYLDEVINLEVGVEVAKPFEARGDVIPSETPGGWVAAVRHFGPYARLHQAHEAIRAWCLAQGREVAGPNWEVYGHWTEDEAKLRTDVYYLLADGE
jgi:effector-binding domain-containing protein